MPLVLSSLVAAGDWCSTRINSAVQMPLCNFAALPSAHGEAV